MGSESQISRERFFTSLSRIGVHPGTIDHAWPLVEGEAIGLLLYGSWARNEGKEHSDIDLLVLSDARGGQHHSESVSVSFYSSTQLEGASRTLFGMHLARDGLILHDTDRQLEVILENLEPPNPTTLLQRVRHFTMILDVTESDKGAYTPGLTQVARYLLRTAIYVLALQEGRPCFSVEDLAIRFRQPELVTLLSSHPSVYPSPTKAVLDDLTRRLAVAVGQAPKNPYESLHGLIVGAWVDDPDLANLATLALGVDQSLPYSEIPKVVL